MPAGEKTMFFKLTGGRHYDKKLRRHYVSGDLVPSKSDLTAVFPGKFVRDEAAEKSMEDPFAGDVPPAPNGLRTVPGGEGEFAKLHPSAPAEMKARAEQGEPGLVYATPTTEGERLPGATAPAPRPAAREPEPDENVQAREDALAQDAEKSLADRQAEAGQTPSAVAMASTSQDSDEESDYKPVKSDLGDDVSEAYPEARKAGIIVLRKGSWYHVADAKDPNAPLNDSALRKEDLAGAIKQYGG